MVILSEIAFLQKKKFPAMQNIFFQTLLLICLCSACGSDSTASHESALPHNKMAHSDDLSDAESQELMAASGKSAQLVTPSGLQEIILADTARVVAVNFWKRDCKPCLELQLNLQNIQTKEGPGKLSILSVNIDPQADAAQVNLVLRTAGITTPVFQLSESNSLRQTGIVTEWDGSLPALSIFSEKTLQLFYQQQFSENELSAVLQPFFI